MTADLAEAVAGFVLGASLTLLVISGRRQATTPVYAHCPLEDHTRPHTRHPDGSLTCLTCPQGERHGQ